jgi:IS6 family transposase
MAHVHASPFPWRDHLLCVRWHCKYKIAYRDLAEMTEELGVEVNPSTSFRWVQRYAPELVKRVMACQRYGSASWRIDETYIKVGGSWKYLFRPVDKHGMLIDFLLLNRRNTRVAHRFLIKAAVMMRDWPPTPITTDKCPSYPEAIARLKRDGLFPKDTRHRTSKYLNNMIEADPGALKQVIEPTRGFQMMTTATATIKGFKIMR